MPYLHHLAIHGVPAPLASTPWTLSQQLQAYTWGPHVSAAKLYSSFVMEDMYHMVQADYWCVLPIQAVLGLPSLKLSPAGVVPQRERRPRIILDYSFPPKQNVNTFSLHLALTQAMQFGTAFPRLMQCLVYCDRDYSPPLMAKLDLADGYYPVPLSPLASLELAVVLPGDGLHDKLVGIPLSLPMGWTHSPPYFCAFTETVTDVANASLQHPSLPHHPLEQTLQLQAVPRESTFTPEALQPVGQSSLPPLATIDVYLDDFMALAQPPRHTNTMRSLLHAVDSIFYDTPPHMTRCLIISEAKITKGNATWSTQKTLLGWNINTATIH
jgi:hypothetical protein